MQKKLYKLGAALSIAAIAGCSTTENTGGGRYTIADDVAPTTPISVEHIENAHPRYEAYSASGNSNYTLRGQRYTIITDPRGFTETGKASWYGQKFQGHRTSNGEVYDMYSMTAAHKTLPLPSFVKVTNTDNGKSVIVRVNDRGPFHPGRIIDLSYAAAYKLDVLKTGTANVKIEALTFTKPANHRPKATDKQYAVQVVSSKYLERVRTLRNELSLSLDVESFIYSKSAVHQLMLGPFDDYLQAQVALNKLKTKGYPTAFIKAFSESDQSKS